ncbi:MAG: hypothetical protein MZU97_01090 [Bacillus subtilis]|nr:hypothetical protein [Bacillus subtilis]
MDTPDLHPVTGVLVLSLYDIGSTVVTIPMSRAITTVMAQIVEARTNRMAMPVYAAAYLESQEDFHAMIEQMMLELPGIDSLPEMIEFRNDAVGSFYNFAFDYDVLRMRKNQIANETWEAMSEWLCQSATADSCADNE